MHRALSRAVHNDDVDEAKRLIALGADPNLNCLTYTTSKTPLHPMLYLAHSGSCAMIDVFLDAGCCIEGGAEPPIVNRPLMLACSKPPFHQARHLIERGADIHSVDEAGWTPFLVAAFNGAAGICELLYERGADPFAVTFKLKENVLHLCWNHMEALQWILESVPGMSDRINDLDGNRMTPLAHMATMGKDDGISLLLDHGADPWIEVSHGGKAVDYSSQPETTALLRAAMARSLMSGARALGPDRPVRSLPAGLAL